MEKQNEMGAGPLQSEGLPAKPRQAKLTGNQKIVEAMEVGGNSMAAMEPFGSLIGAAIGAVEALGASKKLPRPEEVVEQAEAKTPLDT